MSFILQSIKQRAINLHYGNSHEGLGAGWPPIDAFIPGWCLLVYKFKKEDLIQKIAVPRTTEAEKSERMSQTVELKSLFIGHKIGAVVQTIALLAAAYFSSISFIKITPFILLGLAAFSDPGIRFLSQNEGSPPRSLTIGTPFPA